jgi:hypothetical protein
MGVALNCPECGARLNVTGLTPNRMVHCESCEQWVKIPVLPRAARKRGMPGQRPGSGPAPPD